MKVFVIYLQISKAKSLIKPLLNVNIRLRFKALGFFKSSNNFPIKRKRVYDQKQNVMGYTT